MEEEKMYLILIGFFIGGIGVGGVTIFQAREIFNAQNRAATLTSRIISNANLDEQAKKELEYNCDVIDPEFKISEAGVDYYKTKKSKEEQKECLKSSTEIYHKCRIDALDANYQRYLETLKHPPYTGKLGRK